MAKDRKPVEHLSLERWLGIAEKLFGKDPNQWKFKCPACGHGQSVAEVMERHPALSVDEVKKWIYFSCEGREWACKRLKPEVGCDWTLGGFFQIHHMTVTAPDGHKSPVFEFDHPDAEKLIQESCPSCEQAVCANETHPGYAR